MNNEAQINAEAPASTRQTVRQSAILARVRAALDESAMSMTENPAYEHYRVKVRRKDAKQTTISMSMGFLADCLRLTDGDIVKVRRAAKIAAFAIPPADKTEVFSVRARARMLKILQSGNVEWL